LKTILVGLSFSDNQNREGEGRGEKKQKQRGEEGGLVTGDE